MPGRAPSAASRSLERRPPSAQCLLRRNETARIFSSRKHSDQIAFFPRFAIIIGDEKSICARDGKHIAGTLPADRSHQPLLQCRRKKSGESFLVRKPL